MRPKLSIITPCYNSEATLDSTLESVLQQDFQYWEVIIVNDGSTDCTENIALSWVKKDCRFKYFSKQNEGIGKARNFGINKANGSYILPLDSDNLITQDFSKNAIEILDYNNDIGVVHGYAEYFGEKTGLWKIEEFNFGKLLKTNYIDACAIFKKEYFLQAGGYDTKIPYQGIEDWDLWLSFGVLNVKFYHLKKVTFKYYVHSNSMIRTFSDEMYNKNLNYIANKYSEHYYKYYVNNSLLLEKFKEKPLAAVVFYLKMTLKKLLNKLTISRSILRQ